MRKCFSVVFLNTVFTINALAQSDDNAQESWRIEEITVTESRSSYGAQTATLSRTDVPLSDLPQSIQVLNRTLLNDQDLQTLTEALVNVSGVVPNNEAETVLVNPLVRGFEGEIFIDGLIGYGDTAVIDPSSLIGVERIEVAKGPSATLYGGGTGAPVGGLINLVTKTPQLDPAYAFALRTGSFDTLSGSIDLNQPISEAIGFRIAAEVHSSDDFIDDVDVDRTTINPSLRIDLSSRTEFLLRGLFNKIEQLEYTGLPAEVIDLPGVDPFQFTGATDSPRTEIENQSIHASLNHAFSDNLSANLQLRHYQSEFREFSSFAYPIFFPVMDSSAFILKGQLPADVDEWTLDASFNAKLETGNIKHNLLGGITVDRTDYEGGTAFDFNPIGLIDYASGINDVSFGAIPPLGPNDLLENQYETDAVYLQDFISFNESLHLMLSARYSEYRLVEGGPAGSGVDTKDNELDTRVGISYSLTDQLSLFGGYATGSRLSLFFSGVNNAPSVPETSESYEAGIKFNTLETGLSGTLAVFNLTRDNIPSTISINPFAQVQSGEQESEGIELDLIWEPSPNWSVLLNYAVTDTEVKESIVGFGGLIPAGNELSRVPQNSGRVAGHYRFTNGFMNGLDIGLGVSFADEAPLTDFNVFYSDNYTVVDLHLDYSFDNYEIGLNIANVLDEDYFKPYQFLLGEVVRPGQPLSAFLSLKARL